MNVKPTMVRLTHETRERIKALVGDNRISEFIREAVEREIKRRERAAEAKDKR
jgi:predicted DNA-binding protein